MLGKFKNRGIADAFKQLEEAPSQKHFLIVMGWLVKNAHDLTQGQLDYLDEKLRQPWTLSRGRKVNLNEHWKFIKKFRRQYDKDKTLLTSEEIITEIQNDRGFITTKEAASKIFKKIKNYIPYIPATKGRPPKNRN